MQSPLAFINQIKNGDFKLRKVEQPNQDDKKRAIMNKMSKYIDTNRKVPTLDDILNSKSKLKKTYSPYIVETTL